MEIRDTGWLYGYQTGQTYMEKLRELQETIPGFSVPGLSDKESLEPTVLKEEKAEKIGTSETKKKPGYRSSPEDCETCRERTYVDGSDENVSFKSPQHISPSAAGAAVRAHENEHVANAYSKAEQSGGKVLQASVSIHTAVCPECGRTYISGGTTHTKISYPNESNPYTKDRKALHGMGLRGNNINLAV